MIQVRAARIRPSWVDCSMLRLAAHIFFLDGNGVFGILRYLTGKYTHRRQLMPGIIALIPA